MLPTFLDIDYKTIYPEPDNDQLAASFFNRLWCKIHVYNFSILITFYGKHRTGKSLAAETFAYILDPTFEDNLEKRTVYGSKDMLASFKDVKDKKIKGAAFVIDEAGSSDVSSQRWYEESAKIVSAELQSIGYLNPIILFVTQDFGFINRTARKLTQGVFEVDRSNNEYTTVKPFWITNNPWTTQTYHKYPVFCYTRSNVPSNVYKLNAIKLGLPPSHIMNRYIVHSQAFKDKLLEDSILDVQQLEDTKQKTRKEFQDMAQINNIVDIVVKDPMKYKLPSSKPRQPKLDRTTIQYDFNISQNKASIVKKIVERKLKEPDQAEE
jgi:hypothetical protein